MLIGEVARRSGVSTRMLRHYDALGLVRPTGRTVGGYREYTGEDISRIFHVESLRSLGLSLREVARALQDPAFAPATLVADLIRRTQDRLHREQELLDRLRTVDASAPGDWEEVLRIVALLHGLDSPDAARRQQAILTPDADVPAELLAGAVLTETDPNVAGALRWALARAGTGAAHLTDGLQSEDPGVRRRAVHALAELPGEAATAALTRALHDGDPGVRCSAALAAGARGEPQAVPVLVAMVAGGTNDIDAAETLGVLARTHADPVLNALVAELSADPPVRIRVVQALAELPGDLTAGILRRLSGDADRVVAALASALLRSPS
ncbi:HEAT repeat domain-containing protein [Symbioplanes lichenis]|uniref:HEAT repeat domain-containing protein n=1 Tax=Symbioplanes lichenis TaxID=1629072 RepID=UPI002739B460|nr:HEAT repeat domain-containing protein [Actinoplanes lichenis]